MAYGSLCDYDGTLIPLYQTDAINATLQYEKVYRHEPAKDHGEDDEKLSI